MTCNVCGKRDHLGFCDDIQENMDRVQQRKELAEPKALDVQVGGDHYAKMAIQPMEYSMKNGLDACQHTAIKYISRFRDKGGIEDLRKAKHVIDMLIQFEEEKAK
jgi:hypothetical protein